jgi:hypothetical protein
MNNIIAPLEHNDWMYGIELKGIPNSLLEEIFAGVPEEPFTTLTHFQIECEGECDTGPVIPDWFLGGSAPRLQLLSLKRVPLLYREYLNNFFLPPTLFNFCLMKFRPYVHFTRRDNQCPFCVNQPRRTSSLFPIPSISSCPGKPASTFTDAHCPPRSQVFFIQCDPR